MFNFFYYIRNTFLQPVLFYSLNSKVPVLKPGALIDVAKYVGTLAFNVWMKMRNVIKYSKYRQVLETQVVKD